MEMQATTITMLVHVSILMYVESVRKKMIKMIEPMVFLDV